MEQQINKLNLSGFTGTENYYKHMFNYNLTDGVYYLMEKGFCSWLISDIIVFSAMKPKLKDEGFLSWELSIKGKENDKGVLTCTDGNENILFKKNYSYTDFYKKTGLNKINLYVIDKVVLLTSEY